MALYFRFPIPRTPKYRRKPYTLLEKWKKWYKPPWVFLFHLFQFCCIVCFVTLVSLPSVRSIYHYTDIFQTNLFPENDDDDPFSDVNDITNFVDDFLNNLEALKTKTLINFHFLDEKKPFIYRIQWNNGTLKEYPRVFFTTNFYQHVQYFELNTQFFTISTCIPITGCTQWEVNVKIYRSSGSSLFRTEPTLKRRSCTGSVISNEVIDNQKNFRTITKRTNSGFHILYNKNYTKYDQELVKEIQERILNGTLESYIPPSRPKTVPVFSRLSLPLYINMNRLSFSLLVSSVIQFIIVGSSILDRIRYHRNNLDRENGFDDIEPIEQFHIIIGYWDPFFLLTNATLICCSALVFYETESLSQYIPPKSLHAFGVSSFLVIVMLLRWLKMSFGCYNVVLLVKFGFGRLVNLILAQSPFFFSMMLVSVFLFGFVTKATESFVKLFEMILALTFGDNIYEVYKAYTDGTHIYNVHAFVYVTIMTVITMWLFFPTYTASFMYVHHHFVALLNPAKHPHDD